MKTIGIMIAGLLLAATLSAQTKVEIEPRVGIMRMSGYEDGTGFNIGAMASFGITDRFYISPEITWSFFNTVDNDLFLLVPVYASYRIPIKQVRLHLNAGPYGQFFGAQNDFGVSAEVGAEYKKWYLSTQFFQNMINGHDPDRFYGLSLSYKFKLK